MYVLWVLKDPRGTESYKLILLITAVLEAFLYTLTSPNIYLGCSIFWSTAEVKQTSLWLLYVLSSIADDTISRICQILFSHWPQWTKWLVDSPLRLTVAVVAEGTLQDVVQCHETNVFKQLKGLVGVCVGFPFVLQSTDDNSLNIYRWCKTLISRIFLKCSQPE